MDERRGNDKEILLEILYQDIHKKTRAHTQIDSRMHTNNFYIIKVVEWKWIDSTKRGRSKWIDSTLSIMSMNNADARTYSHMQSLLNYKCLHRQILTHWCREQTSKRKKRNNTREHRQKKLLLLTHVYIYIYECLIRHKTNESPKRTTRNFI